MKILLIIVSSFIILTAKTRALQICNVDTAKQALPPRIFYEQTIDGSRQNIIVTRFFHNKLGIFASEFSRCYLNILDFNFLIKALTPIGLIGYLLFAYNILDKKKYYLIIILAAPIIPFFKLPIAPTMLVYKIFAIIGLSLLINKMK